MTARRRPFAFVESWPFVLLMLAIGIALSTCSDVDGPAAAPAYAYPRLGYPRLQPATYNTTDAGAAGTTAEVTTP